MEKCAKSHREMQKNFLGLRSSICLFVKMLHGNFAIEGIINAKKHEKS